ncbi:MAG: M28 family peptidase [Bacteroidota bacterium]|nr:M28 family peptidase [Bacteroidota bacterium]
MFSNKFIINFIIALSFYGLAIPQPNNSQILTIKDNMQIDGKGIPVAVWNVADGSYKGTPADIAKQYLKKHSYLFKLKEDLSDLEINTIQTSPAGTHVRLFQKIGNIPVYNSDIVVSVGRNNVVDFAMNNYKHNLKHKTHPSVDGPKFKSLEAVRIAKNFLGGVEKLVAEPSATLMFYTVDDEAILAYRVSIPAVEPRGDWEIWVDAITGKILSSTDRIVYSKSDNKQNLFFSSSNILLPVNPAIQNLTSKVSATNLTSSMRRLEAFGQRYVMASPSPDSLARSRDWIVSQFQSYGYTDIFLHEFTYSGRTLHNIVVTKPGAISPDTIVTLIGHYDTVNGPDVNDNGSGIALILETARVLFSKTFNYTIQFVCFSAEEVGQLEGSKAYVQNIVIPQNQKIKLVINVDEIGGVRNNPTSIVKVEKDIDPNPPGNNEASALYTDTLATLTSLYSNLQTVVTSAYGSDYVNYENAGYVITGFYEYNRTPYYHTVNDSLVYVDTTYVYEITKSAVAAVAHFSQLVPTGYIFDPDPLTTARATYGSAGFSDYNDSTSAQLDSQRILVPLKDLKFQDGRYFLEGPYVKITDWDAPFKVVASSADPDSFRFNRFDDGFEDVMVYYHIDSSQRYLQKLGFYNIQNLPIQADAHGEWGNDKSSYWPSINMLSFGEGGVDDAEDADVILHEYGHAINYGVIPNWNYNGEQAALAEGFSDYWTASYSRKRGFWTPSEQQFHWVFKWDGHNPFWSGRILNYEALYPSGLVSDFYKNGQMWSSTLMNIWNDIGPEVTDKLVVQSFYYLAPSGVTMTAAAQAVIQADRNLHNGINLPTLIKWFGQRGFISPSNYLPKIIHTQRKDSENLFGHYQITAIIIPETAPLDANSLKIIWGRSGVFTDTSALTATGNSNEFSAFIPGNGSPATYQYFITAADIYNLKTVNPANAPAQFFTFYVGTDTIKPVISHTKINDVPKNLFPPLVKANVTDNIGIDSVGVEYYITPGNQSGFFVLTRTVSDSFAGYFNIDTSFINTGDSVYYRIVAVDSSSQKNTNYLPNTGFFAYRVTGTVDVVEVNSEIPDKFFLSQNYPNPFNPSTLINYHLPKGGWTTLKVFDVLGREVATLVDEYKEAGRYEVSLSVKDGFELSSGVYFYKLTAGNFTGIKKMLLLR